MRRRRRRLSCSPPRPTVRDQPEPPPSPAGPPESYTAEAIQQRLWETRERLMRSRVLPRAERPKKPR